MKYSEILEGRSMPCIVVDVQPAYYQENIIFAKIVKFVANQTGPVLMYCNAEQDGLTDDTVADVKEFWQELGFKKRMWKRVTIVDKGYGFLRSWMSYNISDNKIIKTIRLMFQNKVNDSRELFGGEDSETYEQGFKDLLGDDYNEYVLSDPLITNYLNIAQLKKFNGAYIMNPD